MWKREGQKGRSNELIKYVDGIEIKTEADLLAPGAAPGTIPTDLEQSTGLERLEILGKMQGVDIFDMKPLDASRTGMEHLSQAVDRMDRDMERAGMPEGQEED